LYGFTAVEQQTRSSQTGVSFKASGDCDAKSYRLAISINLLEVASMVWKYIEIVGESPESFADAVREAIEEASKTVRGMEWFEVASLRGRITKDKVGLFQAAVKIGFKVER
jgi:hypothetical protein